MSNSRLMLEIRHGPAPPSETAMELLLTGMHGPLLASVETLIAAFPALTLRRHNSAIANSAVDAAVCEGLLRAVVVIDDPLSSLRTLVAAGHTPLEATRVLTAAAAPLAVWPQRTVLRLRSRMTTAEATAALSVSMGHSVPVAVKDEVFARAGLQREGSVEMLAFAEEVVAPLYEAAMTGVAHPVTWSRASLFHGDHPGEALPRIVDLTGPARVLAYGPYLHLPPGCWNLRVTLAFSPAAAGAPFAVELHADRLLGRGRFTPPAAGVFQAAFPVEIYSAYVPNEIRIVSERGAIEGEIGIDHVRLTPVGRNYNVA